MEDTDMMVLISSHLKRMKFVGHGPMGAKRRKMNTPAPTELPKMRPTSPEVSKSASLSSLQDEEELDVFWDTLPKVDGTIGSTAAGLSSEVIQEEAVQKEESVQAKSTETSSVLPTTFNQPLELLKAPTLSKGKDKAPMEVNPACPTVVPDLAAQPSSEAPTPPEKISETRSILDSINQTPDARIAAAYAWVDQGLYPRDQYILLATDPKRLRGP
ncbi:hypothetical protein Dimus_011010 [Dionaea muscipula]